VLRADFITKEYFMFRGVPDILLHLSAVTTSTDRGAEASDSTSEDEAVENSHQRPTIKGVTDSALPEK